MNILVYLRQFRFFDYAIFDLVAALLGMWLLSSWLSKLFLKIGIKVPKRSWVIWAIPIGIIVHLIFGSMTIMTRQFIDPSGYYFLKIVIISLTIVGFKGVKKIGSNKSTPRYE